MHGMVAMGRRALEGHIEPSSPHWTAAAGGLASAVVPAALPGQTQIGIPGTHTYGYDALGRRVSKTVNGVTTVYINNADWQEVAEYQGTAGVPPAQPGTAGFQPALVQSYVFGSYIDEVLCMVKPDGQRYWHSTNDLYSVQALTDSNGTVVERYMYDPYGKVTVLDANGTPRTVNESLYGNPWTFTGRRLDGETGLMYFRNRMYSADLGRFCQRDPIGYKGEGMGQYNGYFVPRDVDPLGLERFSITAVHTPQKPPKIPSSKAPKGGKGPKADGKCSKVGSGDWHADVYCTLTIGEVQFSTLEDLVNQLKEKVSIYDPTGKCGNCICHLRVVAHSGSEGVVTLGEYMIDSKTPINDPNFPEIAPELAAGLDELRNLLCVDGTVEFYQCSSGKGEKGEELGKNLAQRLGADVELWGTDTGILAPPCCEKKTFSAKK